MRKLSIFILILFVASFAAQGVVAENVVYIKSVSDSTGLVKKQLPPTTHWTLFLDAGVNWFDGDYKDEIKKGIPSYPTVGLGATYNFNGTWGLGLAYHYSMYGATGAEGFAEKLLYGDMHRGQAFITFDIVNMWHPYGKKVFALNLMAGAGGAMYKMNSDQFELKRAGELQMDPFFAFGADCQFNISRSLALGAKVTYNMFAGDAIDERVKGTNNDGIIDLSLSLRYKLGANKKSHVSNEAAYTELFTIVDQKAEETAQSVVEEAVAAKEITPAKHEVQIVRHDTVVVESVRIEKEEPKNELFCVYFDLNKANLSGQSLITIHQVANILKANENVYLEIVGYGDNTGSEAYNEQLTLKRAKNVCDELVLEHGVAKDRVVYYGAGRLQGNRSKGQYSANRRAEIRMIDEATFNATKQRVANAETKTVENKTVQPVAVKDLPKVELTAENRNDAKIFTIAKGMTYSSIALKEYGNAHCWIYIYEANKNEIPDPNNLHEGQMIVLPALTKAQKDAVKNVNF